MCLKETIYLLDAVNRLSSIQICGRSALQSWLFIPVENTGFESLFRVVPTITAESA
jgi:hypothetical protein